MLNCKWVCIKKIHSILLDMGPFWGYMSIFNVSVFLFYWYHDENVNSLIHTVKSLLHYSVGLWGYFFLAFIIYCIPNKKIRVLTYGCVLILFSLIFIVDCFLFWQYKSPLDEYKIGILVSADKSTISEFLSLYVFKYEVVIAATLFIALLGVTYKIFLRLLKKRCLSKVVCIALIISLVMTVLSMRKLTVTQMLYNHFPLARIVIGTYNAIEKVGTDEIIYSTLDDVMNDEHVSLDKSNTTPYVVFILGESADRNHMSLYGYELDTTPRLNDRRERGELAVYSDTIACANSTDEAMKLIFTTAAKNHENKWYDYPNMIDVMKKAGYHTYWISNQEPGGSFGNMDRIFSVRASEYSFLHYGNDTVVSYDGDLLPLLDEYNENVTEENNFYIVHLIGEHEIFTSRYPKDYSVFDEVVVTGRGREIDKTISEYDNAVLYSDYIVDQIIKRFENKNAIVFYISDHGMDLYDKLPIAGHSSENLKSRHMIEIPFVIWGSPIYRERHPDMWERIKGNVNREYRTDDIIHTIWEVLGIKTSSFDESRSIINQNYRNIDRYYGGELYKK